MLKDRIGTVNIPEHLYNRIKYRAAKPIAIQPFQINVTVNGKPFSYMVSFGADRAKLPR